MSCYHPILGVRDEINDNGKWTYKLTGRWTPEDAALEPFSVRIPCGKCIGCRLDYSRAWADRMMLELDHTGKAVFATLTYDNEHIPYNGCDDFSREGNFQAFTLYKKDLQDFFKRLRGRKRFEDKEIRFYAAGEYGSTTDRPHYHAIIFGLSLDDFPDKVPLKKNELGELWYNSPYFTEIWDQGYTVLSEVSWQTCAYVARYVQKKVYHGSSFLTDLFDCQPEFSLMSRRPGIGGKYIEDHPDCFDLMQFHVKGHDKSIAFPKYFLKKLALTDPCLYDSIVEDRKKFAEDACFLKMQQTDLSFIQQMELEENAKLTHSSLLKRL